MCESVVTVVPVSARADELDIYILVVNHVPDKLKWSVQQERGDRITHRNESSTSEPHRHPNHQLLTRPNVDKTIWKVSAYTV